MLDRPVAPATPELASLDRKRRELEELESDPSDSSALRKARVKQAYDDYIREYQLYMGKQDPFPPAATPIPPWQKDSDPDVKIVKKEKPYSYIPKQQQRKKERAEQKKQEKAVWEELLSPGGSSRSLIDCPQCDRAFLDRRDLSSHMRSHSKPPKGKKGKKGKGVIARGKGGKCAKRGKSTQSWKKRNLTWLTL